jgi:hypothetical protein
MGREPLLVWKAKSGEKYPVDCARLKKIKVFE